jgi:Fe-S cluster assembly scaffold protein SufB
MTSGSWDSHALAKTRSFKAPRASIRSALDRIDEGPFLLFYRLVLTEAQAREWDLLDDDGKAEAEGIPVPELDRLVTDAIQAVQVSAGREQARRENEAERVRVPDAIREALVDGEAS